MSQGSQQPKRRSLADNLGLKAKFQRKYGKQGYLNRYSTTYIIQVVLSLVFTCFLALCSFKFWELLFADRMSPALSFWLGVTATSVWVIITVHLIEKNVEAYHSGDNINAILIFCALLFMGGDITFNVLGIPELTKSMMERPADAKSDKIATRYDKQLVDIEEKIKDVQRPFYWCSVHKKNHHKKGSNGEIVEVCEHEGFWMGGSQAHYKKARNKLEKLESEKAAIVSSYNTESTAASAVFAGALSEFHQRLTLRTEGLKWVQIAIYFLLLLLTIWKHQYGAKAAELMSASASTPSPSDGGPSGGSGKKDDMRTLLEELTNRFDFLEKGLIPAIDPNPSMEATDSGRVRSLYADDTLSEQDYSLTERPKIEAKELKGSGFACTCDHCGTDYFAQRKPRSGQGTFCSQDCRLDFHAARRKSS